MEGPNYTLPEDILAEINLLAETEADRLALIRTATILSGRPQLARAHVALSQGSMARLNKVFEDYPILEGDDRDVLMMAHDSVDYDAGYFIEPFDVIKLRPRKTPLRKMKTAPLSRLIDLTMGPEDGKKTQSLSRGAGTTAQSRFGCVADAGIGRFFGNGEVVLFWVARLERGSARTRHVHPIGPRSQF